jgi:hypothetical protein
MRALNTAIPKKSKRRERNKKIKRKW